MRWSEGYASDKVSKWDSYEKELITHQRKGGWSRGMTLDWYSCWVSGEERLHEGLADYIFSSYNCKLQERRDFWNCVWSQVYDVQVSLVLLIKKELNTHFFLLRIDPNIIKMKGLRKAFFSGSNTSCRQHIHQHNVIYQQHCREQGVAENCQAVPPQIMREWELSKSPTKKKTDLNDIVIKEKQPAEFWRNFGGCGEVDNMWGSGEINLVLHRDVVEGVDSYSCWFLQTRVSLGTVLLWWDQRPKKMSYWVLTMWLCSYTTDSLISWNCSRRKYQWVWFNNKDILVLLTDSHWQEAPGKISTTCNGWMVDNTKGSFLGMTVHCQRGEVEAAVGSGRVSAGIRGIQWGKFRGATFLAFVTMWGLRVRLNLRLGVASLSDKITDKMISSFKQ